MGVDEAAAVIEAARSECAEKAVGVRVVVVLVVIGAIPNDVEDRLTVLRKRLDLDNKSSALLLPGAPSTLVTTAERLQAILLEAALEMHSQAAIRSRQVSEMLSRCVFVLRM